jgi:hypothetical protein
MATFGRNMRKTVEIISWEDGPFMMVIERPHLGTFDAGGRSPTQQSSAQINTVP